VGILLAKIIIQDGGILVLHRKCVINYVNVKEWYTGKTYYLVAHFHYVLSMAVVFALFSAWYFLIPKISGLYLCLNSPHIPQAIPSLPLPLQSGNNWVTIMIAGLFITIPSSYLSIVKSFGIGFLFGVPALGSIVAYSMTGDVLLDDLNGQLQETLTEIDRLFSQLGNFINQFHNFVNQTGINVITDAQGELGIDVIDTLDDSIAQQYANRVNVLDSLIHNHIHSIESLLGRVSEVEEQIRQSNSNYPFQLSEYTNRLAQLIRLYGH